MNAQSQTATIESSLPKTGSDAQVRRAWIVLSLAFAIFASSAGGLVFGAVWVYQNATESEVAMLEVISGDGALLRSPSDSNWRLITGTVRVREGDRVSTALGTVVWITMFDGSTVEVTEDTVVQIEKMRTSRFLRRTKLIVLEPLRGTIYVGMAPRGDYRFSETIVQTGSVKVSMADGDGHADAGSFLVDVRRQRSDEGPLIDARVAVLSGGARVAAGDSSVWLVAGEQVHVDASSAISPTESAVRELIENGDFQDGLVGWVEFQSEADDSAADSPAAAVELVRDQTQRGEAIAVEFLRAAGEDAVRTGIRQRIGKTLRVHSSLVLDFEVRISGDSPAGQQGGSDFPLVVELNYLDVDGLERRWSHGYYTLASGDRQISDEYATAIDRDEWQRIVFDLHNLEPLPRQITSIVVYASGQRYATRVTNLSLSSSEVIGPAE